MAHPDNPSRFQRVNRETKGEKMTSTQKKMSDRHRLRAEMERIFADDSGLGALTKYNGRPDLDDAAKKYQLAWSRALVALHGIDRAASVYTQYADARQKTVTETIDAWDKLVLNTKPIKNWNRDRHGFLCCICGEGFTSVVIDGCDDACNRCAQENTDLQDAKPKWRAYSHGEFIFDGAFPEEMTKGQATFTVQYQDDEIRDYVTGEAGLFATEMTPLPTFTCLSGQVYGESRDTINLVLDCRTELQGRAVDILATFRYDPTPTSYELGGLEPHAYGFRFVAARLTSRPPHGDLPSGIGSSIHEYTDLYQMVDALLIHLYKG